MIKRIRKEFRRHFKLVKKFSDRIEADLAREVLEAYHINTYLFKSYFGQMTALFVPINDYKKAMYVLYAG